jgi:hypothetical protein
MQLDNAQQRGKHQDVAPSGPAADFKLVIVGDSTMRFAMGRKCLAHGIISVRR